MNCKSSEVIESLLNSVEWVDAGTREVSRKNYAVRSAKPTPAFWKLYKPAKEQSKDAGIFVLKDTEGAWMVEHLRPVEDSVPEPNLVIKLPPSDEWDESDAPRVVMVPVDELYENSLNGSLYDRTINWAIRESVAEVGVQIPLRALRTGKLIDGWQRWESARAAGYRVVPVMYVDMEEGKEIEAILTYNAQRIKNTAELLREYRAYLQLEKVKAYERTGVRTDKGSTLPEGHREWGKSRDLAAKKVGLGGSTAERGLRVLEEIERRSGTDHAEETRKRLVNQGVDPAFKYAHSLGWIDSALKAKKRKETKASDVNTEATETKFDEKSLRTSENKSEVEVPVVGWLTDDLIDGVITDVAPPDAEEAEDLRKLISHLRPRLYLVAGIKPDASVATKLRAIAKVIEALADITTTTKP